jgi:hypothetical protein
VLRKEGGRLQPPEAPESPSNATLLFRPGSLNRSTDLWFLLLPAVGWAVTLTTTASVRLIQPGTPLESILIALTAAGAVTVLWSLNVLRTQRLSDTNERDGQPNYELKHEYWIARTVAWVLLASASGLTLFLALLAFVLWAGDPLGDAIPAAEVLLLVLTVGILGAYTQFSSMALRTDADRLLKTLESENRIDRDARTAESAALLSTFVGQTDRLVAEVQGLNQATSSGLGQVAISLEAIAKALEAQSQIAAEARAAAEESAAAQRAAVEHLERAERERKAEVVRAQRDRRERIRPAVSVQLRVQGVLLHSLVVDVFNSGFSAAKLNVTVQSTTGWARLFRAPEISTNSSASFVLGDVSAFPHRTQFTISVEVSDVDGNTYVGIQTFSYARDTGFLGMTRSTSVTPSSWVGVALTPTRSSPGPA